MQINMHVRSATRESSLSLRVHESTIEARSPNYAVHRREANHAKAAAIDRAPHRRLRLTRVEVTLRQR
jgi:hypothetical protein